MLCLSLAPNEKLTVGSDVVFVNRSRERIHIGIEAPQGVSVLRQSAKKNEKRKESTECPPSSN